MAQATDTDRLDFLQKITGQYSGKVILRWSTTGRGWRLHESSHKEAVPSVRDAIDAMMKVHNELTMAQEWNNTYAVGQSVLLMEDDGSVTQTNTRSIAWELGCGTTVVSVEGKTGGYSMDRITALIPGTTDDATNRG